MDLSQSSAGGAARLGEGGDPNARVSADYLDLVWRFRGLILGATLLAGAAAFTVSMVGPRAYESTVTLAATQSKLGDVVQISPNTATFRPMVESLTIAADVIRELKLDNPPYAFTPSQFLDLIDVTEIRGTSLLTVRVGMGDSALAARIANSVAEHAVATARGVAATEARYTRDLIKQELDLSRNRLDTLDAQLRDYRRQVRIEVLRKEVETRLGGPQSPALVPSPTATRPQAGGTLVYVDGQSGNRMSMLELQRTIATEKARLAAMDRNDPSAASVRANVAALEQQRTEVLTAHPLDARTNALLDRLYTVETELTRRQVEHDLAERSFADLSLKYQDALLQVIGKNAEFVIVDRAVPADRPASRHVARNTVVAMGALLALAIAGVLVWDTFQHRRVTA